MMLLTYFILKAYTKIKHMLVLSILKLTIGTKFDSTQSLIKLKLCKATKIKLPVL